MNWYVKCIKNYFNFSGRARRKEYWMFTLFNVLIILALFLLSAYFEEYFSNDISEGILAVTGLYVLFIIIPHLAVACRRLHDTNRSGTYWLVRFIPIIGPIWLLVLLVEDSKYGPNKWGKNPKNIGNEDPITQIGKE